METCVRGFSFMPETKVEITDLQYIESGELERTWKTTRRQRLKEQEQKVWDEFVQEKDIVKSICNDNPYQFLHQLPDSCLQELMESELQKTQKEVEQEEIVEQQVQGDGDHQLEDIQHVTFAEEQDRDDCDMFRIFDDDKDDPSGPSGPEDEALNGSLSSPCTVREKDGDSSSPVPLCKGEIDFAENESSVIESSIYCAKVKDLRIKINEEILAIIASLDQQDVMTIEREEVSRICRISTEFSNRFNRIYMYQLQRQMQDLSRNTQRALPFARHTYFHAQMVRVTSLHQNMLQALQVFHKSMATTACLKQSAGILHALGAAARDLSALCAATPAPPAMTHVASLYRDEMLSSCDKLDEAVCEYSVRVADFLSTTDNNTSRSPSRRSKGKRKRGPASKSTKSVPETDARLSMYSLDTIRLNLNTKSSSSRDNHSSGTSKMRFVPSSVEEKSQIKTEPQNKSPKRSPRSRRPLMRAGDGGARRPRPPKDSEITTMVEAVGTCTSSHISREVSPHTTPRRRTANNTPRTGKLNASATPRKPQISSHQKLRARSPKAKVRRGSPKGPLLKALDNIKSVNETDTNRSEITTTTYVRDMAAVKNIADITQNSKHLQKTDKQKTDNNIEKGNTQIDKKDKTSSRAGKDASSGRDCDSCADRGSKSIDCEKDFDSWKDFESNEFVGKSIGSDRATATSTNDLLPAHHDGARRVRESPRPPRDEATPRDPACTVREKRVSAAPARCEVTRLLKQLCSGDTSGNRNETVSGARNAQLLCVSGGSPRPPSTPQLLRILEETIQKKAPKPMYPKQTRDPDRFRMTFNITNKTTDSLFQYRTKFVQHMLASPMYANSAVGKPWEMVGSVSEKIIDEVLWGCSKEMQIRDAVHDLYLCEIN